MKSVNELLKVESVSKNFGGVAALENLSFDLTDPGIYGLIGPNGSGKTTLLNVISGIYRPERGRVLYKSNVITGRPPHSVARMGIGRTFQSPHIFTSLTVRQNILAVLPPPKRTPAEADKILSSMGMGALADAPANGLGYGQLKELEFARTLALDPGLIMLDEPLAGLDVGQVRRMSEAIRRIHSDLGKAFLIIEHHLEELMRLADWVVVLDRGQKIAQGESVTIRDDPQVHAAYFGTK